MVTEALYKASADEWVIVLGRMADYMERMLKFLIRIKEVEDLWSDSAVVCANMIQGYLDDYGAIYSSSKSKSTGDLVNVLNLTCGTLETMDSHEAFLGFFDRLKLKIHRYLDYEERDDTTLREVCIESVILQLNLTHLHGKVMELSNPEKLKKSIFRKPKPLASSKVGLSDAANLEKYKLFWVVIISDLRVLVIEMKTIVQALRQYNAISEEEGLYYIETAKALRVKCARFLESIHNKKMDDALAYLNELLETMIPKENSSCFFKEFAMDVARASSNSTEYLYSDDLKTVHSYSKLLSTLRLAANLATSGVVETVNDETPNDVFK